MTIPSRPAPPPPLARNNNNTAADAANATLEQLRFQLEQQQMQQRQNGGGLPKLSIKLPPPPKNATSSLNNTLDNSRQSSITRKFPKARYTPTTNWEDSPFDGITTFPSAEAKPLGPPSNPINGNFSKKVPPPRPPPPKVQVLGNSRKSTQNQSNNNSSKILSQIFNRKKSSNSNAAKMAAAESRSTRLYNVSSGKGTNPSVIQKSSVTTNYSTTTSASSAASAFTNSDWNAAWNADFGSNNDTLTAFSASSTTSVTQHRDSSQLISFDSPPSSPTFTQKSNSDCVSVDSFSSDSNFSSPQNGSVSQPESGFEDELSAGGNRSRPSTTSPLDPWETLDAFNNYNENTIYSSTSSVTTSTGFYGSTSSSIIGTAPVRNLNTVNARMQAANDNLLCNGKNLLPPPPSLNKPTIIKPKIAQKPKAPKPPVFKTTSNFDNFNDPPTPPSPPMPKCAPPPPPPGVSLLDVISGKADALQLSSNDANCTDDALEQPYGVALYDFDSNEDGDLCFRENERIYLLEKVSDEWCRGRTRSGCVGIFPINFIDIKVPLPTQEATSASDAYNYPKARSLYNFPAEVEGDLPLKENELVTILYRINEDWLFGEVDGRQGQFPANFLECIPDDIPMP